MNDGKFAVDTALCVCKFGTVPALLKVIDQQFAYINGQKLAATTMNLGNAFYPPAFGACKSSWPSRPCTPAVIMWTGAFEKVKVNRIAALLTERSKGTCSMGCPDCIEFVMNGQIAIPGAGHLINAAAQFQGELDPTGESLALNKHQIESLTKIQLK